MLKKGRVRRVFQIAKEANLTSKDIVEICHKEGLFTVKNHMSFVPIRMDRLICRNRSALPITIFVLV
jgi:hypothetical protein